MPNCAELYVSIFSEPPYNESWTNELALKKLEFHFNTPDFIGYVAVKNNAIISFVIGNIEPSYNSNNLFVREFCVDTALQKQGIGTELWQYLERQIQGCVKAIEFSAYNKSVAMKFYKNNNYTEVDSMVFMRKILNCE